MGVMICAKQKPVFPLKTKLKRLASKHRNDKITHPTPPSNLRHDKIFRLFVWNGVEMPNILVDADSNNNANAPTTSFTIADANSKHIYEKTIPKNIGHGKLYRLFALSGTQMPNILEDANSNNSANTIVTITQANLENAVLDLRFSKLVKIPTDGTPFDLTIVLEIAY